VDVAVGSILSQPRSRFPYGCAWQDSCAQQAVYYNYVAYVKQLNEPIEHSEWC
jgi:hypothetical protein